MNLEEINTSIHYLKQIFNTDNVYYKLKKMFIVLINNEYHKIFFDKTTMRIVFLSKVEAKLKKAGRNSGSK